MLLGIVEFVVSTLTNSIVRIIKVERLTCLEAARISLLFLLFYSDSELGGAKSRIRLSSTARAEIAV